MTHPTCPCCNATPMLQTSGAKARNKWARAQCSKYNICGMQTREVRAATLEMAIEEAWRRWDRRDSE